MAAIFAALLSTMWSLILHPLNRGLVIFVKTGVSILGDFRRGFCMPLLLCMESCHFVNRLEPATQGRAQPPARAAPRPLQPAAGAGGGPVPDERGPDQTVTHRTVRYISCSFNPLMYGFFLMWHMLN